MDIMGSIAAINMAYKGVTYEPLQDCLAPFHNNTINSILLQKGKDLLENLMGGISRDRTRSNTNPYDNRTETPLQYLS